MGVLITTTVSVDAQKPGSQAVIHLVRGDSGTRALRLVPTEGGRVISFENVAQAKLRAHPLSGSSDLLLNCELGESFADVVPTPAFVEAAEEWACQLVLLDENNQTISSAPFTVIVHEDVYHGDAIEHTNTKVSGMTWDANTMTLKLVLENGEEKTIVLTHGHPVVTATEDGFFPHGWYDELLNWINWLNQGVKTTDSPTFAGLHIGSLYINGNGEIQNARFT